MRKVELTLGKAESFFMREAFNTLRTNLFFCGTEIKTVVVTSCLDNEGKSTITSELSRCISENNKRVLLIDADLRRSALANSAKATGPIVGLSQVLSGQLAADDAIYETQYPGFDIIFAGPYPPNPLELLSGTAFRKLVADMRERYDYVMIDAAPLGLVVDASAMAGFCDGTILVVNRGKVRSKLAVSVKQQLERSKCRILGVVLNQTSRKAPKDRGYYGYYYQSGYGYGKKVSSAAPTAQVSAKSPSFRAAQTTEKPDFTAVPKMPDINFPNDAKKQ